MKVIKRGGQEVKFNLDKIKSAIIHANESIEPQDRLSLEAIDKVVADLNVKCKKIKRALNVEEIQDMVEDALMASGNYALARSYITYRYNRALVRKANTTDESILSLIELNNEEVLPVEDEELKRYGITDVDKALIEKENVYLIYEEPFDAITDHYLEQYNDVEWNQVDELIIAGKTMPVYKLQGVR